MEQTVCGQAIVKLISHFIHAGQVARATENAFIFSGNR